MSIQVTRAVVRGLEGRPWTSVCSDGGVVSSEILAAAVATGVGVALGMSPGMAV